MKQLFLIDGNSLANRAFYAMPYLTNKNNQPSGAVFGFANIITKLILEEKPDELIVAFDFSRKTFRNNIYENYKAHRKPMPEELKVQFPFIKEMLELLNIKAIQQEGIEADDIIGTIAKTRKDIKKIIISGDRDLLQLIDDTTEVWITKKGITDLQKNTINNLKQNYGYYPNQVADLKGLMGDASDNIPGVDGIGEKTALKLIEEYDNINNIYNNIESFSGKLKEKLILGKDDAVMSKDLATIRTDCSLENIIGLLKLPFNIEAFDFFKDWNFASLIKKQELFEQEVLEDQQKDIVKIKIENIEQFKQFKTKISNKLAYDLQKMQFSINENELYFVDQEISLFNQPLDLDDIILELKDTFENLDIEKITKNLKNDFHYLSKFNIQLNNYLDLEIANYLIGGGIKLNDICQVCNYFSLKNECLKQLNELQLQNLYFNCELPLVNVLFKMERDGFKINKAILNDLSVKFNAELQEIEKQIFDLAQEEFNINSPKQVAYILFDKLNLKSYNNKKQSTGIEFLLDMIGQHQIVEELIKYRKINKIISTYINVYTKLCETKGDIIHTIFNQTTTATGRLSSIEPNLQNIPTRDENGKEVKKIFISKFEGGKILSADYNQIELRLMAAMSEEANMIEAYNNNVDIHSLTASKIFAIPLKDVSQEQRQAAKSVNFGVIYGISDYGLSQNIKTSRQDAKYFIDNFFANYPNVRIFNEKCIEFAEKNGYVKTLFGRIRKIPEINSSNKNLQNFGKRTAMNMPLQGSASDIIKFAMIKVAQKLENLKSQLILQIHDELVFDVFPGEEEQIIEIVKTEMENVVDIAVKIPVSVNIGENLFECK